MSSVLAIINSQEAYFDFVFELHRFGQPEDDYFRDEDADGLSLLTKFRKLSADVIEQWLGISDSRVCWEEVDEDGEVWEVEYINDLLDRSKMRFVSKPTYTVPGEKDYPIMVRFQWDDSYDRGGKVQIRLFEWDSVGTIPVVRGGETFVKRIFDKWKERYEEKYQELVKYQIERRKAQKDKNSWSDA